MPLKVCYKVSLSKNFQRQSCCAFNEAYLSNGINILAGDDPVPVKFGPNRKDARFTFHTRRAVQSAMADLHVEYIMCFEFVKVMYKSLLVSFFGQFVFHRRLTGHQSKVKSAYSKIQSFLLVSYRCID